MSGRCARRLRFAQETWPWRGSPSRDVLAQCAVSSVSGWSSSSVPAAPPRSRRRSGEHPRSPRCGRSRACAHRAARTCVAPTRGSSARTPRPNTPCSPSGRGGPCASRATSARTSGSRCALATARTWTPSSWTARWCSAPSRPRPTSCSWTSDTASRSGACSGTRLHPRRRATRSGSAPASERCARAWAASRCSTPTVASTSRPTIWSPSTRAGSVARSPWRSRSRPRATRSRSRSTPRVWPSRSRSTRPGRAVPSWSPGAAPTRRSRCSTAACWSSEAMVVAAPSRPTRPRSTTRRPTRSRRRRATGRASARRWRCSRAGSCSARGGRPSSDR